jgi:hypothetical protein
MIATMTDSDDTPTADELEQLARSLAMVVARSPAPLRSHCDQL